MAAKEGLLTQSAVTQQIKALESELDVPLFDRAGGRVSRSDVCAGLARSFHRFVLERAQQLAPRATGRTVAGKILGQVRSLTLTSGSKVRRAGTGFSPYINPAQHEAFRP